MLPVMAAQAWSPAGPGSALRTDPSGGNEGHANRLTDAESGGLAAVERAERVIDENGGIHAFPAPLIDLGTLGFRDTGSGPARIQAAGWPGWSARDASWVSSPSRARSRRTSEPSRISRPMQSHGNQQLL